MRDISAHRVWMALQAHPGKLMEALNAAPDSKEKTYYQALTHVLMRQYQEATALLETLPDDPQAKELLRSIKGSFKREEWYESDKFKALRLANNLCADVGQLVQRIDDALGMVDVQFELLGAVSDKRCIVDRQLRILRLEADNLWSAVRNLSNSLEPHKFEDWPNPVGEKPNV